MERVGTSSKAAKPTSKDPNEVVLPTPYPPSFFYTSLLVTKPPSSPSNEPLLPFPPTSTPLCLPRFPKHLQHILARTPLGDDRKLQ